MNDNSVVGWLVENIPLHLDWCNRFVPANGRTRQEVLTAWVKWGLRWDLIRIFKTPNTVSYGYLFARPARLSTLLDPGTKYFEKLFTFEPDGEVIWIDTIWAPGCYAQVLEWLRSKETEHRNLVAWEHKNKFFVQRIDALTGNTPQRREIEDALIRSRPMCKEAAAGVDSLQ